MKRTDVIKKLTTFICSTQEADYWDSIFWGVGQEVMYLKMNNGELIEFIAYASPQVKKQSLYAVLKEKEYKINQVRIAIHSHEYTPLFTAKDIEFYLGIKDGGFKGKFQIYCRGVVVGFTHGGSK